MNSAINEGADFLGRVLRRAEPVAPYPYQNRLAQALERGGNLIVSAPTGSGKTWAVLMPYLLARHRGERRWDRILYALPLRSLASSLWRSTMDGCAAAGFHVRQQREGTTAQAPNELSVTIQTGEQRLDPFFNGDIVFATIDQLLGSYLHTPLSLPQRVSNINPGALLGSLLVLDEVHLLDPGRALGTALDLAERLRDYVQVVVMTATLSTVGIERLAELLHAEVVRVDCGEIALMPSQRDKQRTWRWSTAPLSAEAVLDHHHGGRSLVLCNTVTRAQALLLELQREIKTNGWSTKCRLLHSRFFRDDRRGVEASLPNAFGPESESTDEILVATQVLEAGVDISADELHTELCPANALIQRAGRCARYEAPRNTGTVNVYDLKRDGQGRRKVGPYRESDAPQLIELAAGAVQERHSCTLGFEDEQNFLNQTLAVSEARLFADLAEHRVLRRTQVSEVIDTGDRSRVRQLIREVDNIGVLIHAEPESVRLQDGPELLSVPRSALFTLRDNFAARGRNGQWSAKIPIETSDEDRILDGWMVADFHAARSAPWLVALHPEVARYTPSLGLIIGEAGYTVEPPYHDPPAIPRSCYRRESFQDHAARTRDACRVQASSQSCAARALDEHLQLPPGTAERLGEIASALHDTGKLGQGWQDAIWAWQLHKTPGVVRDAPLAHSDYHDAADWKAQRAAAFRRPPHAVEGAYALAPPLAEALLSLVGGAHLEMTLRAVLTAVARHHAGHATTLRPFALIGNATGELRRVMELVGLPLATEPAAARTGLDCANFGDYFLRAADPRDAPWMPMYWFVARRLRLADQWATAALTRGEAACG